jgi:hypothetical protein
VSGRDDCNSCGATVSLEASQASERLKSLGDEVYVSLKLLYGTVEALRLCAACFLAAYGHANSGGKAA